MGKDVIIACDFSSEKELFDFLGHFEGMERKPFLKVGMELFYAAGPQIVRQLKGSGYRVFLDLKLHDIPNTVEKAMRVLAGLGADMCNVHAAGTEKMMAAALRGLNSGSEDEPKRGAQRPLLIAVTQLTSTSGSQLKEELLIERPMEEVVAAYAEHAGRAGLDGVVCSPLEAPAVHQRLGKDFITVTPGVRLEGDAAGDQSRVTTPAMARQLGSDYIVVGRSITRAADPASAYLQCVREFTE